MSAMGVEEQRCLAATCTSAVFAVVVAHYITAVLLVQSHKIGVRVDAPAMVSAHMQPAHAHVTLN